MYSSVEEHVIDKIANSAIVEYPFPHVYVEWVFPGEFYRNLRKNWPSSESLVSLPATGRVSKNAYKERFVMAVDNENIEALPDGQRQFWVEFSSWLLATSFLKALLEKFRPYIEQRFSGQQTTLLFSPDSLVVRDRTNYAIGPHTDAPHRLLSLLFYCPDNDDKKHLGTSFYAPVDPNFRCNGGPHYPHNLFKRIETMEYRPNTLLAFFKTDHSFHGVEPITDSDVERDLLLYDIRVATKIINDPLKMDGARVTVGEPEEK